MSRVVLYNKTAQKIGRVRALMATYPTGQLENVDWAFIPRKKPSSGTKAIWRWTMIKDWSS
jgi:hypothetical protein